MLLTQARIGVAAVVLVGTHVSALAQPGDVIHRLNTHTVSSLAALQVLTEGLTPHSEVVLQIERNTQLRFVVVKMP
jgi:S1-C subfamily serine protease